EVGIIGSARGRLGARGRNAEAKLKRLTKVLAGLLLACVIALAGGALVEPMATKARPVATTASPVDALGSVAQFALLKLGNYLANQPNEFGQFLKTMGLGDASHAQLDAIEKTVGEING